MKPGDIVKLVSWLGQSIKLAPEINSPGLFGSIEHPPGTIVLILDVLNARDGSTEDAFMRVLVGGKTGYVWAYECEEIK
jgi:hypothetical protein